MKKTLSLFLILFIACIVSISSAEEFTLHSGITFGMTMDQVMTCEKSAGFKPEKKTLTQKSDATEEGSFYFCSKKHLADYIYVEGQIAGQKDAAIRYHFNSKKQLDAAVYEFFGGKAMYKTLRESLIKKYGEAFDTSLINIWLKYLHPDALNIFQYSAQYVNVDYHSADSWLIPQDNGDYILIIGLCGRLMSKYDWIYIGYQRFGKTEVQKVLEEAKIETQNAVDQLNNDL